MDDDDFRDAKDAAEMRAQMEADEAAFVPDGTEHDCANCGVGLQPDDIEQSMWLPEWWCTKCRFEEEARSVKNDRILDTAARWRMPRYLLPQSEWYYLEEPAEFTAIMKSMEGDETDG